MKIVFFGTPPYVLPILEALHKEFRSHNGGSPITAVVTQRPKPIGRKHLMQYTEIDHWAHKRNIPIFFDSADLLTQQIHPDIGVLAAYGEIIPQNVLDMFPYGILNIHPSLLPKYRGASPVQASIVYGEIETGVTIMKMDALLDHGPVVSQFKEDIKPDDTTESLRNRLFERSAEVLTTLIPAYLQDKITPREQKHDEAIFTRQITKEDGFIPPEYLNAALASTVRYPPLQGLTFKGKWEIPFVYQKAKSRKQKAESKITSNPLSIQPSASSLLNFIRAMYPWPGAWTYVQLTKKQKDKNIEKQLKIIKAHLELQTKQPENKKSKTPQPSGYCLVPDLVQLEGKSPVSWKQFGEGYPEMKLE